MKIKNLIMLALLSGSILNAIDPLNQQLLDAAVNGNLEQIETLLRNPRINVNAKGDDFERTALIEAAIGQNPQVIEVFLSDPRVDVNPTDNKGQTALMWAALGDNPQVVETFLRDPRVDVNAKNNRGQTALMKAVSRAQAPQVVETFLRDPRVDVNAKNNKGKTVFDLITSQEIEYLLKQHLSRPRVKSAAKR